MDYVVLFEGRVFGPFTSADPSGATGDATTDACLFRNANTPGSPIMELTAPASFTQPFPPSEATG